MERPYAQSQGRAVLKWLLTLIIAVTVLSVFAPTVRRLFARLFGVHRIPGDITVSFRGNQYFLPFGSTIVFTLLCSSIFWILT